MPLANACPKPSKSRLDEKQEARAAEAKEQRECYAKVNAREEWHCRVTGVSVNPMAVSQLERGHHHHMVYRSRGGAHETNNVILVSAKTHQAIHNGELRTTGDADVVKGVLLERWSDGWIPERWIWPHLAHVGARWRAWGRSCGPERLRGSSGHFGAGERRPSAAVMHPAGDQRHSTKA